MLGSHAFSGLVPGPRSPLWGKTLACSPRAVYPEFLTKETSCPSEMSKRTTSKKFWQKRPPGGGGTIAQTTRVSCHLDGCRHTHAVTANVGMLPTEDSITVAVSVAGHSSWRDADMIAWQPATNGGGDTPATCADSDSHATVLQIGSFPRRLFANWKLWGYLPPHTRQPVVLIEKFAL
jgi:hypothetical protein